MNRPTFIEGIDYIREVHPPVAAPASLPQARASQLAVPKAPELMATRATDIKPERVEWLWGGRLAFGKHTAIGGDPGAGKSQIVCSAAAAATTGGLWPCREGTAPDCSVVILNAEDGAADTIVPRLMALNADLNRIHIINAVRDANGHRGVNLQHDLELLEHKVNEIGDVGLISIDPISSYLGKADSHKNAEVRSVLEPLGSLAGRTKAALLSVTHFSKSGNGSGKALHRFIGSIGFVGAPRIAFAAIEDAESPGRYLLLHAKNNLAAPPSGLAYRLEQTLVTADNIVASRIVWEGQHVDISANEALAADNAGADASARHEAEELLRGILAAGPVAVQTIRAEASSAGMSWSTVRRAQKQMQIRPRKAGMEDGWVWELPTSKTVEDAH
jgi:AAA domain